ncbi:MAG: NusG domain II-containing protein [Sphaerochaetaceae bacterium]|jgi:hypothetical protein|nr:NusG domain II-containing protein [Sphaerochaetaceae bacterium]MDY0372253.1 NusG domain II-containing protein [Sphaerochaetaceae bacterium]
MKKIRLGDIIIFLLSLVLIGASFGSYGKLSGKPEVRVQAEGREWVYDLSVNTTASFSGPVGTTSIEIHDGKVHVLASDCRNKVCIAAGWISSAGEWIICLPNNVFIRIEGSIEPQAGGVDDISF